MHIILASASPNRKELLERIGLPFSVVVSNVCENVAPGLSTAEYVMTLARQKAESVAAAYPEACVIGADTVVDLDGRILGKPHTPENAKAFLSAMQGRKHLVYTGLAVSARGVTAVDVEKTSVTFAPMSEEEIDWYVASGDPLEKAGAYGIQGPAGLFISAIDGDYFNVVGLPVHLLYRMLRKARVIGPGTVLPHE
ncbi:MAG: septum formation inhibitor Maf [Clostridia bacterium]|nr:septum formation inhibitor Maf [Clostridia bacterium]MBR0445224.1 septum formation inhibitor Maf [Clostridia bacterium]